MKLYYVAQVAYAPPTFVIQCNRPEAISDSYRRFVENRFRQAFGLEVPCGSSSRNGNEGAPPGLKGRR